MAEYCDDGRYKIYRPPIWLPTGKYRAKVGKNISVGNTADLTVEQKADLYNNRASNILFVKNSQEIETLSGPSYNIPRDRMIVGISPKIT